MGENQKYCQDLFQYSRFKSRVATIGKLKLGEEFPIRVQTMTNTDTKDADATFNQCINIIRAGAELIRIAVPNLKELECLKDIYNRLRSMGYNIPIVADTHFNPKVALEAAKIVEKVRINPGNFGEENKSVKTEFTKDEYHKELQKLEEKFIPLINICIQYKTALRIGVNHGSLSKRIIGKYGDTPLGMVESAMEYLRICYKEGFNNVVVSLKASNTMVMVQATRLLTQKMLQEYIRYPLHLGVTEAGEGEDGRIKSAVGIGTLLADGIGDSVRVSLTEEPEEEIPVAKELVNYISEREVHKAIKPLNKIPINPFEYKKRKSFNITYIGENNPPIVITDLSRDKNISEEVLSDIGWHYTKENKSWTFDEIAADYIYLSEMPDQLSIPDEKGIIVNSQIWNPYTPNTYPIFDLTSYLSTGIKSGDLNFLILSYNDLNEKLLRFLEYEPTLVFVLVTDNLNGYAEQRAFFFEIMNAGLKNPIIIRRNYRESVIEDLSLKAAVDIGGLFLDGLGDGIWIKNHRPLARSRLTNISFAILQASRARISKTEFISCPSCGRTNFNIIETSAKIRERTAHLKGLKIAIMGCIVNGIGEMADADYGYVGAGGGKIILYKNKEVIKRHIPEKEAVEELVNLIKEHGDWREP